LCVRPPSLYFILQKTLCCSDEFAITEHKHEHGHDHDHKKEDDVPAWKKKALESGSDDPMAAPFGGTWNAESSVDATKGE